MRAVSPVYRAALATSHGVAVDVSSWRSGKLLAANIPVLSAQITYDDTATLRRRLAITVPVQDPVAVFSWDPGSSANHPLANYGQRLKVRAGIVLPTGQKEMFDHGWYLITGWELSEDERNVSVTAVDLAQLLVDDRLYTKSGPGKGRTYRQAFTTLVNGSLPVAVDSALPGRLVNGATVWERDRIRNLDDLADAWGARWYVDDAGNAHASKAYTVITTATVPVLTLVSGANGTVVDRKRDASRDRLYNAVIVNGKTPTDNKARQPYGRAEITLASSPIRVSGPYGRKPRFYTSEMLTTDAQCQATALSLLPQVSSVSRSEPVICIPDPSVELGDVVQVKTGGSWFTGRVTSIVLPLTADQGAMTLTLSNEPDLDDES